VRLPKLELGEEDPSCVKVTAPASLKCEQAVWLCPVSSGGGIQGHGHTRWDAVFVESTEMPSSTAVTAALPADGGHLLLSFESGDELTDECVAPGGFTVVGKVSVAERARLEAAWRREQAAEASRCESRVKAQYQRQRVVVTCEVLLVDPCHREAFTRCAGRNATSSTGDGLPALNRVLRHGWEEHQAAAP
jgi:hypothetical protein